jgi:uncharacterized iron-regulated membrane protein
VAATNLTTIYVDPYSGQLLPASGRSESAGDQIVAWAGRLHVGNVGGGVVKTIWLAAGLAPTILFVTGFITWWRRVVRPARDGEFKVLTT